MTTAHFFLRTGGWRPTAVTALLAGLVLASTAMADTKIPSPVAFDWFEYTGRDPVYAAPVPPGHFQNPILAGFYPDPSICRVGDDFYLVNSTFAYFPGIPIFHSRDLVHWTQIGNVVDRPDQLNYDGLGVSRGIFAPALSYHEDVFHLVCTFADAGGNFLMTATNPAGPWSNPVWLDFDGIDPSLFFDEDGRAWLLNNGPAPDNKPIYEGHRAIYEQQFDLKTNKLVGPRTIVVNGGVDLAKKPIWIEGPHLFRRGDWYYLCCAEGGTGDDHSQVIFRSRTVTGPFVPSAQNPILTQRNLDGTAPHAVTSTGHAQLVIGPDGNWWSVFLGCQPFGGHFYATGRETFLLPVAWNHDDWPLILAAGERVPYVVAAPKAERVVLDPQGSQPPLTGNFTHRDNFAGATLPLEWLMLRRPRETWWQTGGPTGGLLITPRPDTLFGRGNPAFLGRRLQNAHFEATTELAVPSTTGVSAGLTVFQNETHHYYFGVRRNAAGLELFVERLNGGKPEIVAATAVADSPRIELRLTGDDAVCAFAYSTSPDHWHVVADSQDATLLSTQVAGGFVGAIVGMHARVEK